MPAPDDINELVIKAIAEEGLAKEDLQSLQPITPFIASLASDLLKQRYTNTLTENEKAFLIRMLIRDMKSYDEQPKNAQEWQQRAKQSASLVNEFVSLINSRQQQSLDGKKNDPEGSTLDMLDSISEQIEGVISVAETAVQATKEIGFPNVEDSFLAHAVNFPMGDSTLPHEIKIAISSFQFILSLGQYAGYAYRKATGQLKPNEESPVTFTNNAKIAFTGTVVALSVVSIFVAPPVALSLVAATIGLGLVYRAFTAIADYRKEKTLRKEYELLTAQLQELEASQHTLSKQYVQQMRKIADVIETSPLFDVHRLRNTVKDCSDAKRDYEFNDKAITDTRAKLSTISAQVNQISQQRTGKIMDGVVGAILGAFSFGAATAIAISLSVSVAAAVPVVGWAVLGVAAAIGLVYGGVRFGMFLHAKYKEYAANTKSQEAAAKVQDEQLSKALDKYNSDKESVLTEKEIEEPSPTVHPSPNKPTVTHLSSEGLILSKLGPDHPHPVASSPEPGETDEEASSDEVSKSPKVISNPLMTEEEDEKDTSDEEDDPTEHFG